MKNKSALRKKIAERKELQTKEKTDSILNYLIGGDKFTADLEKSISDGGIILLKRRGIGTEVMENLKQKKLLISLIENKSSNNKIGNLAIRNESNSNT